ncbi:MAG TPA: ribose-phosphate diphosphokinase [Steroidobacteraceae bacterium]|jgi:ribose-phosphate pyrophosphokinase
MKTDAPIALFAPQATHRLGAAVAAALGTELARHEERRFAGGEFKIRPLESVRGRHAWVLQSLYGTAGASACDRLCEQLFLAGAIRDAGAEHVGLLFPYLAFARKDRRTKARDPLTSRYVAQMCEAVGVDRVAAVEVHNPAAFENAHRIPAEHLSLTRMFAEHFAHRFSAASVAVVSPDLGGSKRAQLLREALQRRIGGDVEFGCVEKRRSGDVVSGGRLVGEVAGRQVIVLDDLISSGDTMRRAARICREAGARGVHAAAAHAPFAPDALHNLAAPEFDSLTITDTVPLSGEASAALGYATVLPVAELIARATACIEGDGSLSDLLERG